MDITTLAETAAAARAAPAVVCRGHWPCFDRTKNSEMAKLRAAVFFSVILTSGIGPTAVKAENRDAEDRGKYLRAPVLFVP